MKPVHDLASTKYPDRMFYAGRWRTPESVERHREGRRRWQKENPHKNNSRNRKWCEANPEKVRERNAARLIVGGMFLGSIRFTQKERERMLNGTPERP